jgi:hypothetical protein
MINYLRVLLSRIYVMGGYLRSNHISLKQKHKIQKYLIIKDILWILLRINTSHHLNSGERDISKKLDSQEMTVRSLNLVQILKGVIL